MVAEGDPDGCDSSYDSDEMEEIRAAYAAALSAAEAERPDKPDHLAYADSPVWDDGPLPTPTPERPAPRFKVGDWARDRDTVFRVAEMHWDDDRWYARPVAGVRDGIAEYSLQPASPPAPEVVDVPQPEPWHARLVRLAQEAQAASKACAEAEAAFTRADAVRETARLVRAAARETCHVKRQALTAATTAAAIVEAAQQPATAQPTRPEPRYKVGDWVRVVAGPNSARRINPIRVTCVTSAGYIMADGASWAAEHLTPALDPALHETARKTVAWLRGGARGTGPADFTTLPGWSDWNSGSRWDAAEHWAAQLERLLGDAP